MDKFDDDTKTTKLERKLVNKHEQDFVVSVRKMDKQELDAKLLDLAKYAQAIRSTMESDLKLEEAKNIVKELKRPYNEDILMNKEKARFIALVMEDEYGEIK